MVIDLHIGTSIRIVVTSALGPAAITKLVVNRQITKTIEKTANFFIIERALLKDVSFYRSLRN